MRENRTAGCAWGFGHKGEILRPNSTNQQVDKRFEKVDKRFDKLESKFDRVQWFIVAAALGLIFKEQIARLLGI